MSFQHSYFIIFETASLLSDFYRVLLSLVDFFDKVQLHNARTLDYINRDLFMPKSHDFKEGKLFI